MKRANKRKETEANFEEKKMNMGLDEATERETEREPPERIAIQKDPYYDNMLVIHICTNEINRDLYST